MRFSQRRHDAPHHVAKAGRQQRHKCEDEQVVAVIRGIVREAYRPVSNRGEKERRGEVPRQIGERLGHVPRAATVDVGRSLALDRRQNRRHGNGLAKGIAGVRTEQNKH